jgi:acetylornithine deacetylase/succinyl-diaminopimelate desuccinylase-like protein
MKAVRKGLDLSHPGLPIVPQMSVGATDSLYFRAVGVPSYGVGGAFLNPDDDFSHGLNERAPIASIDGALLLWHSMLVDLAG